MSALPKVAEAVRSVLKMKAREGQTTKGDATLLAWKKIELAGGPTPFGIGRAAMRMACLHIIETEVTRQLKSGLSDHETTFVLPPTTPAEIREALGKIPRWIAIEEGPDALWINSLTARCEHWAANALMKEKKAKQTEKRANMSMDIARYLTMGGFNSLKEAFGGAA